MEESTKPKSVIAKQYFSRCNAFIIILGLFILGIINNLGFNLVLTCSHEFSEQLKSPGLIALYPM